MGVTEQTLLWAEVQDLVDTQTSAFRLLGGGGVIWLETQSPRSGLWESVFGLGGGEQPQVCLA